MKLFLFLFLLFCAQLTQAAEVNQNPKKLNKVLRLGLLPYLSPNMLHRKWRPLADYLQKSLGRRVVMVSAPNFSSYVNRAESGKYDFYMTAPHFAVRDSILNDATVLMRFSNDLQGDVVVTKDSDIKEIKDLKNKVFATPDKLAIITLIGEKLLKNSEIDILDSIRVNHLPSHNAVLLAVSEGRADAGIAVGGLIRRMPPKVNNNLRVLKRTELHPHAMIVAHSRIPNSEIELFKKSIFDLQKGTEKLKSIVRDIGFGNLIPVTEQDIKRLRPILPLLTTKIKNVEN